MRIRLLSAGLLAVCSLPGCAKLAPQSAAQSSAAQPAQGSPLASSSPTAGSTAAAPVNALKLHFNPPARLDEVTVRGPDGLMPMMVTAVGEVANYSLPLAGLGPGAYIVNWKAWSGGREYQGSFSFTVK